MHNQTAIRKKRALDFLLYVLFSILLIIVIGFAAIREVSWELISNWIGFAFSTLIVFGYFIENSRTLWSNNKFRWLTAISFIIHVLGYWEIVRHIGGFKPLWFWAFVPETAVLIALRRVIVARK